MKLKALSLWALGVFLWKLWYSSSLSLRLPAGVNWWQLCRLGCAGYQSRLFKLKPSAHRSIDPGKSACPPGSSTPMAPPAEFWGQHLSTGWVSLTMSYPGGAWTNAAIQSHWNCGGSLYMYIQWFTINVSSLVHFTQAQSKSMKHFDLKILCLSWTIFTIRYISH